MKRKWKDSTLDYFLGEQFDQTVIVAEASKDGQVVFHHFGWDGMKHKFHHTGEDSYGPDDDDNELDIE